MNRRSFAHRLAAAVVVAPALSTVIQSQDTVAPSAKPVPHKLSVMLWTVFRDLPFEQRLEKVAAAGYSNVELVGEYEKWSDADFERVNAARQKLGINFDCTAGLKRGLCNPADRDLLASELRKTIPIME